MKKKILKIKFVNYFNEYSYRPGKSTTDIWSRIMPKTNYNIVECQNNQIPDIIVSIKPTFPIKGFKGLKIFHTGENQEKYGYTPDESTYDILLTFRRKISEKCIRTPSLFYWGSEKLLRNTSIKLDYEKLCRRKFCCFVQTNPNPEYRKQFFKKLSKYKKVDSGGRLFNNIGYVVSGMKNFVKDYKFMITMENSLSQGYCTEKIGWAFRVNTIPIYWGDTTISKDFNTKSFINAHDYDNMDKVIQKVIELDNNDDLYIKYTKALPFRDNKIPYDWTDEYFVKFFNYTFDKRFG